MKLEMVTCEHCGEQVRKEDAIIEKPYNRAWCVAHYGLKPVAARSANAERRVP